MGRNKRINQSIDCIGLPRAWNVAIWTNKLKKNNEQVRLFVDKLNIIALRNLREAFFGGKNNAIKFYHKVQDDDDQITPCC